MNKHEQIKVRVAVAVSENGNIQCCIYDDCNVQVCMQYDKWMKSLRDDKYLWSVKLLTTSVNYPYQSETIE
jgi:hypothetical protein